jgi:hypothetical protein
MMAVSSAGKKPAPPPTTWPERLIERNPRTTWSTGLALWGASALALALHAHHVAFPDPVRFSMLDSWLIGLGCLGCPVLALRALGKWLTPTTCLFIGAIMFALALLLTALTLTGEMHPAPLDATFGLILPEALGIHAVNAADVELRASRREQAAYREGRIDALTDTLDERYAALAGLDRLGHMELPALEAIADIVAAHIAAHGAEPRSLHLVAQPGEHRPGREPITRRCPPAHSHAAPEERGSPTRNQPPRGRGSQSNQS